MNLYSAPAFLGKGEKGMSGFFFFGGVFLWGGGRGLILFFPEEGFFSFLF